MEEEYKVIDSCSEYAVSNLGNVKNLFNNRILKGSYNKGGQKMVCIMNNYFKKVSVGVHRLVAECFIPNKFNKSCVIHIDGDNSNNTVSNLKWAFIDEVRASEHLQKVKNTPKKKNETKPNENKGIYYKPSTNEYKAMGFENGEIYYLGLYKTIKEAKKAQDKFYTNEKYYQEILHKKSKRQKENEYFAYDNREIENLETELERIQNSIFKIF